MSIRTINTRVSDFDISVVSVKEVPSNNAGITKRIREDVSDGV